MSPTRAAWPFLRMRLDMAPGDEAGAILTTLAADAGASGSTHEPQGLIFYFDQAPPPEALEELKSQLEAQAADLGRRVLQFETGELADAPWATAWQDDFKDTPVGERLLVRPEWLRETSAPAGFGNRLPIILLPGQGFGTGRHETTRLAMEMVEECTRAGDRVLDFGTGSGILAVAAMRLGAACAVGMDYDPAALENARDNLALNGMSGTIQLIQGDSPACLAGKFDLIVCNVLPQFAMPVMAELAGLLSGAGARLAYSGFLVEQREEIDAGLAAAGLAAQAWRSLGEWGAAACCLAR